MPHLSGSGLSQESNPQGQRAEIAAERELHSTPCTQLCHQAGKQRSSGNQAEQWRHLGEGAGDFLS
ncbi:MAG: hypothetical protein GY696_02330 [Gammaproteobacteria bacterium]|nr:hypothetical protein [Gammaproteobacteria bacterium]